MRKLILHLLFLLPVAAFAQGFVIDTFQVRIDLSRDGYFDVREDIFVTFAESKHGIFRSIPYRFAWNDSISGERALNRGEPGSFYETPIVNINVPRYDFSTSTEGNFQTIKIGSSTQYVSGHVHYQISYRVYGALNQFIGHDEFYWNLTGNDWKVNIEYTSFEVNLPGSLTLAEAKMRSWTGALGTTTSGAVMELNGSKLTGHCPSRLMPGHGATIGFSMPKGFLQVKPIPTIVLAKDYSIRDWESVWILEENESWLVREKFVVDIRNQQSSFTRTIPETVSAALRNDFKMFCADRGIELISAYELNDTKSELHFAKSKLSENPQVEYQFASRGGIFAFGIEYRVWPGCVEESGDRKTHFWEPIGELLPEPAEHAHFRIEVPGGIQSGDEYGFTRGTSDPQPLRHQFVRSGIEINADNILPGESIQGSIYLPKSRTQHTRTPARVYCSSFYFSSYEAGLTVQPDGRATLSHQFSMVPTSLFGDYHQYISTSFGRSRGNLYAFPRHGLLRQFHNLKAGPFIPMDESMSATESDGLQELSWSLTSYDFHKRKQGGSSIELYDLLRKNAGGGWEIFFPITESLPEPCDSFSFRLSLPGLSPELLSQVKAEIILTVNDTLTTLVYPLTVEGDGLRSEKISMISTMGVNLRASLPQDAIHKSVSMQFMMVLANNSFLALPLVLLIFILPIWYFKGRDKNKVRMVQFYPPDDITPTEAGLLVDDKLHNRDLLSLFYYWAYQGIIKIETEGGNTHTPRITFVKIKSLPKTARSYERTLFNGIFKSDFKGGTRIILSSLKYTFYDKMAKARKEVNLQARTKNFYVPGSKAWSGWMKFAAWLFFVLGIGALSSLLFGFGWVEHGRWEVPVGYLASWAVLFFFGRKMIKRGPFGAKAYDHLMGFKEFIEKAEKDKLERLLEKDLNYFEHTLSYAIAFGMANRWVTKFNDLLTTLPEWYTSGNSTSGKPFDATLLNKELSNMLNTMSAQLNSTPPKTTGSGSTWTNSGGGSSSSSSSSSSSYSGGGGSYSSGGYSGGGYGGGGGGSW